MCRDAANVGDAGLGVAACFQAIVCKTSHPPSQPLWPETRGVPKEQAEEPEKSSKDDLESFGLWRGTHPAFRPEIIPGFVPPSIKNIADSNIVSIF